MATECDSCLQQVDGDERDYHIWVCESCGQQVAVDEDAVDIASHCAGALICEVRFKATWDKDVTKYGLDRAGLLINPSAHLVPPPEVRSRATPARVGDVRPYEQIADQMAMLVLTPRERAALVAALDEPTDDFKRLAQILDCEGCNFPKAQAALMLLNTPGAAAKLLETRIL